MQVKSIASLVLLILLGTTAASATPGKDNYDKLCLQCHGATGGGDGPVGLALPEGMKPASFQAGAFKFASDLAKFKELITKGGAAVGLNPMMPPQAGLADKDLEDLYAYVKSLKK